MRKWLVNVAEWSARHRLSRNPQVTVSPNAKVKFRNLRICQRSTLKIEEGSIVEGQLVTEREGAAILLGKRTFLGNSLISCAVKIEIGDDVLISWGCTIVDHNSHALAWSDRKDDVRQWYQGQKNWLKVDSGAITIGNKSWLGFNVGVLKGVSIGEGAVVGAGSIVTKDVEPWTIVAGNPARIIREIPNGSR